MNLYPLGIKDHLPQATVSRVIRIGQIWWYFHSMINMTKELWLVEVHFKIQRDVLRLDFLCIRKCECIYLINLNFLGLWFIHIWRINNLIHACVFSLQFKFLVNIFFSESSRAFRVWSIRVVIVLVFIFLLFWYHLVNFNGMRY